MLYNKSENENYYIEKNNKFKRHNSIKKKLLTNIFSSELSQPKNINKKSYSKKAIFSNNNYSHIYSNNYNEIYDMNAPFSNQNINNLNSEDKNKKYYIIKSNKNIHNKRGELPPINSFRFKFHKLRLNVNNEIDYTDQQHEEMMKQYKEIEFKNKNRFFV